ncbi:MAG: hypothetical protein LLF75_04270 [Eubacteriales bacterium]|nr:hypothetical protein [Eubacteriales bacterium]
MIREFQAMLGDAKNFVLLGESGCGKSEIALNLAFFLSQSGETHVFDLDQTKPLFRSRDVAAEAARRGVSVHFSEQYYDAPTLAGGVPERLANASEYTVLDVGGNDTGARMIGRFAATLNQPLAKVFYVVNTYRPWSKNYVTIDGIMTSILKVSRLRGIHILTNPNIGAETTEADFRAGLDRTHELLDPFMAVEGVCVQETLFEAAKRYTRLPVFPLRLFLNYDWSER